MSGRGKSRWIDEEADAALELQNAKAKEEKKRRKAEKQRQLEDHRVQIRPGQSSDLSKETDDIVARPAKRRRVSQGAIDTPDEASRPAKLLRFATAGWAPCRHVEAFKVLNHIEEGSYGWVSRAEEVATGEVVALKKLKMEHANDGFPVTGLREIQTLMASRHPGVVNLREVVMGDTLDEYAENSLYFLSPLD